MTLNACSKRYGDRKLSPTQNPFRSGACRHGAYRHLEHAQHARPGQLRMGMSRRRRWALTAARKTTSLSAAAMASRPPATSRMWLGRYLREYLSLDGMIFMWSLSGRGSPARPEGLEVWLNSDPAPPSGRYFLEAMFDYAVTGPPFQSLAAAQVSKHSDARGGPAASGAKPQSTMPSPPSRKRGTPLSTPLPTCSSIS